MECKICRHPFTSEITFATLFLPVKICPKCRSRFVPGWHRERIPIFHGVFDYLAIFSEENLDYQQGMWLFRHMEKCFKLAIYAQYTYELVLFVDELDFATAEAWIPTVLSFEKVLVFSLFYYDFSRYEGIF
jgi:hypothetical protein